MITLVYFVRHAEPEHDNPDDRNRPLTTQGMIDSSIVLDTLQNKRIDSFYCSPYKRSLQTILPAAQAFLLSLAEVAAKDPHPQVRQYAAKAIGRYAENDMAALCLDKLKDVAREETAPNYVRTAAAETVSLIEEAQKRADELGV